MVLAGETVTAFTELITPLHPTNGPWQFLTLFESQRFSPQGKKKKQGWTATICDCPLCFSPSVRDLCLLSQFHNYTEFCEGGKGEPRRKPIAQARERTGLLYQINSLPEESIILLSILLRHYQPFRRGLGESEHDPAFQPLLCDQPAFVQPCLVCWGSPCLAWLSSSAVTCPEQDTLLFMRIICF